MARTSSPRLRLAVAAGRALAAGSRRLGAGGGSTVGGRLTLALDPRALEQLGGRRSVTLVSGTNGKTTTTRLLARALASDGRAVTTNDTGANLAGGLVAALSAGDLAPPERSRAALEVDEGFLPRAMAALVPRAVVLLNLSRDQLDRIGEVRTHAERWHQALAGSPGTVAVANADDPLVVWAAGAARSVRWVGTGQRWRSDATTCGRCAGTISWDPVAVVQGGPRWECSTCGLARPTPEAWLEGSGLVLAGTRYPLDLALPGWPNRANAAMATVAAMEEGLDPQGCLEAISGVTDVAGRYRHLDVDGISTRMLLAKNPAGWAETLDMLDGEGPVVVGINARVADGRDPSWLWDVDFERLAGRWVVAAGERARDLSVRLAYAEVDHATVTGPWREAVRLASAGHGGRGGAAAVDLAANYTAFQAARRELAG